MMRAGALFAWQAQAWARPRPRWRPVMGLALLLLLAACACTAAAAAAATAAAAAPTAAAVPSAGAAAAADTVPAAAAGARVVGEEPAQQEHSCDEVAKVPAGQRCAFVRDKCPSESLVPYAQLYFCHVARHNVLVRGIYLLAVCCLLPLAFCLLGDTAEFYIAPIMAHVSQAIPKMRPRFAGVTFVALGNGAPDLSANIAAISAGEVTLSAGALTGAAMFVQCVVAAELVAIAGDTGIKCGGAMLRDVGVYGVAVSSVLLAFALGKITRAFVGWAIALYIMYMIWVFVGDEWHDRGRPKPQLDPVAFRSLLNRIASRGQAGALGAAAGGGGGGGGLLRQQRGSAGGAAGGAGVRGAYAYGDDLDLEQSLLPWVDAEAEEDEGPLEWLPGEGGHAGAAATAAAGGGAAQDPPPAFEAAVGASPLLPASATHQQLQQQRMRSTELSSAPNVRVDGSSAGAADGAPVSWQRADHHHRRASEPSGPRSAGAGPAAARASPWSELPDGAVRHASATLPQTAFQRSGGSGSGDDGRNSTTSWLPSQPQQRRRAAGAADASSMQQQQQQQQLRAHMAHMGHVGQPHVLSLGNQRYIDPKTYKQLVWADLADEEEEEAQLERQIARQLLAGHTRAAAAGAAAAAAGAYQPPALAAEEGEGEGGSGQQAAARQDQQQQQLPRLRVPPPGAGLGSPGADAGDYLSPFGSAGVRSGPPTPAYAAAGRRQPTPAPQPQAQQHGMVGPAAVPYSSSDGVAAPEPSGGADTWQQLQLQVTLGNSEEWVDAAPIIQLFRKVTFPALLPAYLGQRLTIPFVSAAGYSREWLLVSLLCCPLALIAYLGLLSMPAVLSACGAGIASSLLGALLTAWDQPGHMAAQGLGGRVAAAVPGALAVLAFCMGVVWIDTVATEVVGALSFLAGLAALPAGVMGLTLLAWGNSLGDFFGNRAMARAGHTSTAITACFAAPLFNLLFSLAMGFSSYLHKRGASAVAVALPPEVALGCVALITYNIAIICIGHLCGQRLPPWFRHFARAWYALYFVAAVASGFAQQRAPG